MKETEDIVKIVINDRSTITEINNVINTLKMTEKHHIPISLIIDYLKTKSNEVAMENLGYTEKTKEMDKILEEYIQYLNNILEMYRNKEIVINERVKSLIDNAVNSQYIGREDKIYLANEQKKAKDLLKYLCDLDLSKILIYIAIDLIGRLEILKIEKNILQLSQTIVGPKDLHNSIDLTNAADDSSSKISVYKISKNTPHPIKITGRTTHEDFKKILAPDNPYTMTIEQYGENMIKIMEEQGIPMNSPEAQEDKKKSNTIGVRDDETDQEEMGQYNSTDSQLNKDELHKEIRRKNNNDDEFLIHYGDGNRTGRK